MIWVYDENGQRYFRALRNVSTVWGLEAARSRDERCFLLTGGEVAQDTSKDSTGLKLRYVCLILGIGIQAKHPGKDLFPGATRFLCGL